MLFLNRTLLRQKQQLELQVETLAQREALTKQKQDMEFEKQKHVFKMENDELRAQIVRERKNWSEDKEKFVKELEDRELRFKTDLESDSRIKLTEAVKLHQLDAEQKTKQIELQSTRERIELERKYEKQIADLKVEHQVAISSLRDGLLTENFKKLQDVFERVNQDGTFQMKNLQEIFLAVLDRGKEYHVNKTELLTGTVPVS